MISSQKKKAFSFFISSYFSLSTSDSLQMQSVSVQEHSASSRKLPAFSQNTWFYADTVLPGRSASVETHRFCTETLLLYRSGV
jgi:hypothetical protein